MNYYYLSTLTFYMKNYPVWKTMTKNNLYVVRIMAPFSFMIRGSLLLVPLFPFVYIKHKQYDLKELNEISSTVNLPYNTFQHRQSAHYVEINKRYMYLMGEEFENKYNEIAEERN